MRAVDTNVLVRLITRDDAKQAEAAEVFVAKGAWVSHAVLMEAVWVLDSVFELRPEQIATTISMLLSHQHLTVQDAEVVESALVSFRKRPSLGYTDHLILAIARKSGHVPLGTFDRELCRLEGVERL